MKRSTQSKCQNLLYGIGIAGIIVGGSLSAFMAQQPTREVMLASAFIVLILGLAQMALNYSWTLFHKTPPTRELIAIALYYNVGCALVLAGTLIDGDARSLVIGGVVLFMAALLRHVSSIGFSERGVRATAYYASMTLLTISSTMGLYMSFAT